MLCDLALLLLVDLLMLVIYPSADEHLPINAVAFQTAISIGTVYGWRIVSGVYRQIWRYGGTMAYMQMILSDFFAGVSYYIIQSLSMPSYYKISFVRVLCIVALNLLCGMTIRFVYQYLYEYDGNRFARFLRRVTACLTEMHDSPAQRGNSRKNITPKINIAVVGAGRVGVMLAEELANNPRSAYRPCCFIDIDKEKIGRSINGIPVLSEMEATQERLMSYPVQEIVFALPQMAAERKKELYDLYKQTGCKIKVYDYPLTQTVENGKRSLREFDIEELLFRQPMDFAGGKTGAYYRDKVVLISGGGGSIGSELCRQIAKMQPKKLIILDVYENGAYDIQQELKIAYGVTLSVQVEIVSVCDAKALDCVFAKYHPDIVLHAAAHKHVPLMEHNCCEAVKNNVFGTLNIVEAAEKYGVKKFTMISTDKAVNPTNVMGATKRMCEMIVLSRLESATNFSATRFGNVLGSNGSVIPLFKRQIMNGGPVTLTDRRIIRYFMTIPEASQLVLESGAMAKNGELYVLDMGKPVRILELAENMIRLSGYEPYKDINIVETGLRPGEKLYEELLIKTEELDKTENRMIFVERDKPLSRREIEKKLDILRSAVATENDETVRRAMKRVVPTYHAPEEVNCDAKHASEMRMADEREDQVS
ncbi:MAG: polysaccharide biosynthesis protein [Clostridia bacterium]|nr:polysaccharide biosynthesis protein [Clostridia bacterium]